MIDYLLVFGLLLLLVALSLPTMIQLAVALGMDEAASSRIPVVKSIRARLALVTQQPRPTSVRIEPEIVGRAAAEPRLAH